MSKMPSPSLSWLSTVARNWLTHTGKENVENAITIIVMIVNYCSKLSDPSQVPQPKLRNDFQVSWRIWLDWPTLWMRTWQVPCGAITLFHSSGNGVKTCCGVSTQVNCSHCTSQHPENAIFNLDAKEIKHWFHRFDATCLQSPSHNWLWQGRSEEQLPCHRRGSTTLTKHQNI